MSNLDFQIERLKEELKQGKLKRDKLATEVGEKETGVNELQKKLFEEYTDDTDNQWKSKYDKQYKTNTYLEHELSVMKEKLEALSKIIDESPTAKKSDQPDLDLRSKIKQLEHEKTVLESKVKNCEWHLDSESKDLFKLNEKKKEYMLKLNQSLQLSAPLLNRKKDRHHGLPDNQRILDPRKGPINKQALVSLPKITTSADKTYSKRHKKAKVKKEKKESLDNNNNNNNNEMEEDKKNQSLNNDENNNFDLLQEDKKKMERVNSTGDVGIATNNGDESERINLNASV